MSGGWLRKDLEARQLEGEPFRKGEQQETHLSFLRH